MSTCLEFGPDQNFKPRKPQAVETSGSQLWSVHPRGDVEQPREGGRQEKPPRNSFQPSFSHFSCFLPPYSSLPHFLHPTASTRTNAKPIITSRHWGWAGAKPQHRRSHGGVGRRTLPVGSSAGLNRRDHGLGLGLHFRKGQYRQDYRPARQGSWG